MMYGDAAVEKVSETGVITIDTVIPARKILNYNLMSTSIGFGPLGAETLLALMLVLAGKRTSVATAGFEDELRSARIDYSRKWGDLVMEIFEGTLFKMSNKAQMLEIFEAFRSEMDENAVFSPPVSTYDIEQRVIQVQAQFAKPTVERFGLSLFNNLVRTDDGIRVPNGHNVGGDAIPEDNLVSLAQIKAIGDSAMGWLALKSGDPGDRDDGEIVPRVLTHPVYFENPAWLKIGTEYPEGNGRLPPTPEIGVLQRRLGGDRTDNSDLRGLRTVQTVDYQWAEARLTRSITMLEWEQEPMSPVERLEVAFQRDSYSIYARQLRSGGNLINSTLRLTELGSQYRTPGGADVPGKFEIARLQLLRVVHLKYEPIPKVTSIDLFGL
jgi:hypothetical protein